MLSFATLFDYNYLSRGLCLADSLATTLKDDYHLYVLALDAEVHNFFRENPNNHITVLDLASLEESYPELLAAKENRSIVEYYFTLSPVLPLYILTYYPEIHRITTLDADIYFYSDPSPIFKECTQDTILITPHDFPPQLSHLNEYGKYNVSFQSFPNTPNGLQVLNDWKEKCIAWCGDHFQPESGYFADQKYLDEWENRFESIQPITLKTCGRAPWNIACTNYRIGNDKTVFVENNPLVYFHFHHLRLNGAYIGHALQNYQVKKLSSAVKQIYSVYVKSLKKQNEKLRIDNDHKISRNIESGQPSLLLTLWRKEYGAVFIFNKVFFYDIKGLKQVYNRFRKNG